jgi:hypothetical protein
MAWSNPEIKIRCAVRAGPKRSLQTTKNIKAGKPLVKSKNLSCNRGKPEVGQMLAAALSSHVRSELRKRRFLQETRVPIQVPLLADGRSHAE